VTEGRVSNLQYVDDSTELLTDAMKQLRENRKFLPLLVALSDGPRSFRALTQRLGYENGLRAQLTRLCQWGLAVKTGKGVYCLVGLPPELVARAARLSVSDTSPVRKVEARPAPVLPAPAAPPLPVMALPPVPTASKAANSISAQFKVPAVRSEGEANLSAVRPCVLCQTPSPLRYGTVPICYRCARKS
jgi:hypothetical protein